MRIDEQVPLKTLTTLRAGGPASYVAHVESLEDLREALAFARSHELPFSILGGGSNILASDDGFQGVLIRIECRGITTAEASGKTRVIAAAGESWDALVEQTVSRGLWGLENLSGIPGSVGATPVQNVGAYGVEVKDSIEWVETFDTETGETRRFSNAECRFGYRDSFFKSAEGKSLIITAVSFLLSATPSPRLSYKDLAGRFPNGEAPLQDIRSAVLAIRAQKFPDLSQFGTAGSFFKNPIVSAEHAAQLQQRWPELPAFPAAGGVKLSLAWILEALNLKDVREGDVGTFARQPLVIVNYGGATAAQINTFVDHIASAIKQETEIEIEREVRTLS